MTDNMTGISPYFKQRIDSDQLDVIPLLYLGLTQGGERCIVSYEGREVTANEMCARVGGVQAQLRHAGVRPGDRVAVMLSNSVEHIALIYALILYGAVWVPVNVRLRGMGLAYIVEHSRPVLMVFDDEFEEAISELRGVRKMRLHGGAASEFCASSSIEELVCSGEITYKDPLCIIYTSGTTGAPKGVVFTHRMLRIASEAAVMVAEISDGDRAFLWEPLCHIGGAQMLMMPFLAEAQLHIVKRFSASKFWSQWEAAPRGPVMPILQVLDATRFLTALIHIQKNLGAR